MEKRKPLFAAGLIAAATVIGAVALAAEDHNSSRSNLSSVVAPGSQTPAVTYSFNFNLSTEPGMSALTKDQFEAVVDQALAEAKKDMMAQYAAPKPQKLQKLQKLKGSR